MTQDKRPLSPHLQIYQPQLTWLLSITHRMTGIALTFGLVLFAWWIIAAATGPEAFGTVQEFIGSWLGRLMLFGWTLALFFHLLNGIRHLAWDAGYGFELPAVYRSGWAAIGGAIGLTIAAWIAAYALM